MNMLYVLWQNPYVPDKATSVFCVKHGLLIAEHLCMRLLILQSMFSVGRVWPQLPSRLGMQLKDPAYKKLCSLM